LKKNEKYYGVEQVRYTAKLTFSHDFLVIVWGACCTSVHIVFKFLWYIQQLAQETGMNYSPWTILNFYVLSFSYIPQKEGGKARERVRDREEGWK